MDITETFTSAKKYISGQSKRLKKKNDYRTASDNCVVKVRGTETKTELGRDQDSVRER